MEIAVVRLENGKHLEKLFFSLSCDFYLLLPLEAKKGSLRKYS